MQRDLCENACKRARVDGNLMQGRLSEVEIQTYKDEGWLIPKLALPVEYVDRLRASLDRVIEQNPGIRPERLVSAHLEKRGAEGVQGTEEFLDLALHPLILDVVEQLIGHDICLWGCQIFCKPAGDGMEVPMHQDGHYWPIRPLATVTVWIALDHSNRSNGCLRVVPRSHVSARQYDHYTSGDPGLVLNQAVKESELEHLQSPVDVELEPGEFSLHDVYLVHGSCANTSPKRRAGVALRYMPTTSTFERDLFPSNASSGYTVDWKHRPIFLVRGRDRCQKNTYADLPNALKPQVAPPGFIHTCQAVPPSTWIELECWLKQDQEIPWEVATEGRRVAQWGVRYDYSKQNVDLTPVAAIPEKLRHLFPVVGPEFTQCIINEYKADDGIPWHCDHSSFGPDIHVFCFGDARPLLLRRSDAEEENHLSIEIGHLDSYFLSGDARYTWEHSVPKGYAQRLSVTFRSVANSTGMP